MEPVYIGTIFLFAFPRAPLGWAICDGRLMPISGNEAIFSLLGTIYGGDGNTTFALPDLRGRVPLHMGQGPGLTPRNIGERGGGEHVTLMSAQIPPHHHQLQAAAKSPAQDGTNTPGPQVEFAAASEAAVLPYADTATGSPIALANETVGPAGSNGSHDNMMPTLVMNYCIALEGLYPQRD